MCGIAGILNRDGAPVADESVRTMAAALDHRGPDGEGVYTDGALGFGHRRLAILDLTPLGDQPMSSPDGRHVVVYNGEIYNFRELRTELEGRGFTFRSRSDTEVLLAAWAAWGKDCVHRFNGMFAFALWDRKERRLFLARDRYGIKPLYYTWQSGTFLFASEQKALLTYPSVGRTVDTEALLEYFTFQNLFTDRTLLKGIHLFPAGCRAVVAADGTAPLQVERYWDFDFCEPAGQDREEEYVEELDRLFRQAVKRQMVSDVEVGSYLSGGMDSASITSVLAAEQPWVKTFTCGFDMHSVSGLELNFDEREKAEYLSYLFRTEHYEVIIKAGDMERCLPELAWHLEEPRVGQSYPNYYVSRLASRFLKVIMAGTGGDELFGGYPWRYYRAADSVDFEDYIDRYYLFWQRLMDNRHLKEIFAPVRGEVEGVWTRDLFRDVFPEKLRHLSRPEDYVNHSLYFEAKTFLHGLLLVEDKLSMAHHLEVRLPFLDNDLVDFAMTVPVGLKLRNLSEIVRVDENEPAKHRRYFLRSNDGKMLLRKAMDRHIPPEITSAIKQGFSAPDATWFKGQSMDYVRSIVFDGEARMYNFFDPAPVQRLVSEHLEGKVNRRLFIWSLLNFEWWLRRYVP